jgi:hypothetical protein
MKLFLLAFFLAAPAFAAEPILDLRNTSGMGWLTRDLTAYDDGSVMCSKLVGSNMSTPVQVTTLTAEELAAAQASIAAITPARLVRLDQNQGFNPGGFTATYTLVRATGEALVFAKNVSGVDYGFANQQGQDLVKLLQALSEYGCGR